MSSPPRRSAGSPKSNNDALSRKNSRFSGKNSENWVKLTCSWSPSTWARSEDGATLGFQAVTAALTYFPGNLGAYLRGGVGFGNSNFEVDTQVLGFPVNVGNTDSGWALLAAGGYEWRLSNKFALGPELEFVYFGLGGELIDAAGIINGTLQFNWYW